MDTLEWLRGLLQRGWQPAPLPDLNRRPDRPVSFGYRMMWLAVRAEAPAKVAAEVYIRNIAIANWQTGIASAYEHGMRTGSVFLSPCVDGWVLVVGGLPDPGPLHKRDPLTNLLKQLSERFGEVQYFGSHRVAQWHAWARWVQGEPLRAYAYSGDREEPLWNLGEPTPQEHELGLIFSGTHQPGEDQVMQLAGAWSVDPSKLDTRGLPRSAGLYAEIADTGR